MGKHDVFTRPELGSMQAHEKLRERQAEEILTIGRTVLNLPKDLVV